MDWEEQQDAAMRAKETKTERRARRKKEMDRLLLLADEATYEENSDINIFVMNRTFEIELFQFISKAKQGRYTDEEIGKQFRHLFKDF